MDKKMLKPGMLVQLNGGQIATVAIKDSKTNSLMICWSGRSLDLDDYSADLFYQDYPEYDYSFRIKRVYDVGNYSDPFLVDVNKRNLLWDREKTNFFSTRDKSTAARIGLLLNNLFGETQDYFIENFNDTYVLTELGGREVLKITGTIFDNSINGKIKLNDIVNYKEE